MGPHRTYKKKNIRWFRYCKQQNLKKKQTEEDTMKAAINEALHNENTSEESNKILKTVLLRNNDKVEKHKKKMKKKKKEKKNRKHKKSKYSEKDTTKRMRKYKTCSNLSDMK